MVEKCLLFTSRVSWLQETSRPVAPSDASRFYTVEAFRLAFRREKEDRRPSSTAEGAGISNGPRRPRAFCVEIVVGLYSLRRPKVSPSIGLAPR